MPEKSDDVGESIRICGHTFRPAPDEWDRLWNVDFFLELPGGIIGLQIKPGTYQSSGYFGRWKGVMRAAHRRFETEYHGKVFVLVREVGEAPSAEFCDILSAEVARLSRMI